MTSFGDWGRLNKNIEKVKDSIAKKRDREPLYKKMIQVIQQQPKPELG